MGLSLPHILIFAVIAILLLGGGRFSNMMGDVAKGVKNFKKGMCRGGRDHPRDARQGAADRGQDRRRHHRRA